MESSQDFGAVTNDGHAATQTITVTNQTGNAPLDIGQATVTGANAGDFTVASDGCSTQTVNGGDTCTATVQFAPTARGAETATLTLPSNDAGSPATVTLTGTGQNPAALSVESSQDFGAVTNDGHNATQTITVTNTGDAPLDIGQTTVTGANAGDFTVASDGCSTQTVNGGDTCTATVQFAPTARGAETATLTLPSNDAGSPATVTLTGTGQNPAALSVESSQDFGAVTNDGHNATQTITVTNTGDAPLDIGQTTVTGANAGDFTVASDGCSTQTVNGGDTCTATVQFAPTARGAETATLTLPSNDAGSPATVTLTGTGQNPAALSVESSQDFGAVTNDGHTATQTITVTNQTGNAPLDIGQTTVTGANAGDFTVASDGCSTQTVNGGDTCTATVQFAPTARGAETATLTLPSNDAGSPATVTLTGTGTKPADISASDTSLDLGTLTTGQSNTKTLTLTNIADEPLTIGTLIITGTGADQFALAGNSDHCSGQTLARRRRLHRHRAVFPAPRRGLLRGPGGPVKRLQRNRLGGAEWHRAGPHPAAGAGAGAGAAAPGQAAGSDGHRAHAPRSRSGSAGRLARQPRVGERADVRSGNGDRHRPAVHARPVGQQGHPDRERLAGRTAPPDARHEHLSDGPWPPVATGCSSRRRQTARPLRRSACR